MKTILYQKQKINFKFTSKIKILAASLFIVLISSCSKSEDSKTIDPIEGSYFIESKTCDGTLTTLTDCEFGSFIEFINNGEISNMTNIDGDDDGNCDDGSSFGFTGNWEKLSMTTYQVTDPNTPTDPSRNFTVTLLENKITFSYEYNDKICSFIYSKN